MITDYQLALLQQFYMKRASDIARDKMVHFQGRLREFRRQFTLFPHSSERKKDNIGQTTVYSKEGPGSITF